MKLNLGYFSLKMAFVSVPKDLSLVKSRLAFNMSKRQLICFGIAAAIGIPAYIFTRKAIGNTGAALLMMGLMLPLFLLAMYEKDGQPAEKVIRNYIRTRFYWPPVRPYKTENFYAILEKEAKPVAAQNRSKNTATATYAKTPVGKHPAGESKPQGYKENSEKRCLQE
jgi:hypothetical protein